MRSGWSPRLAPTTVAETDVCLCSVVALNKHGRTHAHKAGLFLRFGQDHTAVWLGSDPHKSFLFMLRSERPVVVTRAPRHPSKIHVALRLHFLRASIRRRHLKLRPVAQAEITALLAMNQSLQSFQLSLPLCCSSFCSQLSEAREFTGKRRGGGPV